MDKSEEPPFDPEAAPIDDVLRRRIAQRAYEISESDEAGTDEENWLRAEQELSTPSGSAGD